MPAWPARTPIDEPSEGKPFDEGLARSAANHAALTPASFLERAAAVYPNKPAIIHDARVYSYAEFAGRARRLASALARRGIGIGDTVAIMAPNVPAMLEAHYGIPMAGAVLNPLNYRLDAGTIAFILQHADVKLLITDTEFSDTMGAALQRLPRPIPVVDIVDPLADPGGGARASARPITRRCSPRATPGTNGRARQTSGRRWRSSTPRGPPGIRRASCTPTGART